MERLLLTALVLAILALGVWGMRRSWLRQARSQSVRYPPLPEVPEAPGDPLLPPAPGLYVSTTAAGRWQDRIVTRGMGLRSSATLTLRPAGVVVQRHGAPGFLIPAESLLDAGRARAIAGKVMGTEGLLVITWRLGERPVDTGFRADDIESYDDWIDAVRRLRDAGAGARQTTGEAQ